MILLFILSITYPIDSWQAEALEEALVRGEYENRFPGIRPYPIDPETEDVGLPALTNTSFYFRRDTVTCLRFKPRLYCDREGFSFLLQPVVKFGSDSLPPSRVFAGLFSGDYERASLRFRGRFFGAFIGRERFSIGPSARHNLLLSGSGAALDWFHYDLGSRVFRVSYFLSRLEDMTCQPVEYVGDTITQLIDARRYLVIKRLDVSPADRINFSFSEAATFGGEGYGLDLYQLNPVVLLHTYQHNREKAANLFFHLDAKAFFHNLAVYGALLVDDYQLEPDPNGEPNHIGFQLGIESCDRPFDRTYLVLEYTRVSRWTYCIFTPYQRYEYRNHPMGFPSGPGCDELYAKAVWHVKPPRLDLWTSGSFLRKGESETGTAWPIPEEPRVPGTRFDDNNFLYGTVQKTLDVRAGARFILDRHLAVQAAVGLLRSVNDRHVAGTVTTSPVIDLQVDALNLLP